jgi:pyruvate kinase
LKIDPAIRNLQGFKSVSSAHNIIGVESQKLEVRKAPALPSRRKKKIPKERRVIICQVEFDCELKPHKPLYFPEFDHKEAFDLSVVTIKDIRDIDSAIKLGVDFIAVSYVESKDDILEVRELLSVKGRHIKVIAKIQNRKALQNFDEILAASDGVIIARGYLGLDLKLEDVAYV